MKNYRCFTRCWWKDNPTYPNGLEPDGTGRQHHKCYVETIEDARDYCQEYNKTHDPGRYSIKCEFEGC